MRRLVVALLGALVLPSLRAADVDWAALEKWIARQQTVRTLEAEFTQTRRLPTLRLPSVKPGKLWFDRDGRFRFQLGDPPEMIALRRDDDFLLVDPRKKTVREVNPAAAGPAAQQLLLMRFPVTTSLDEFRRLFDVQRMESRGDRTELDLGLRDANAAKYVRVVQLEYVTATGILTSFRVELINGSGMETNFQRVEVNGPAFPAGTFDLDLGGYEALAP